MSLDKYTTKKPAITKVTWEINHLGVMKEQN